MHSERGSMLVQVGILLLVLVGVTAWVADYGLLWVSRRQAQNAADAAALAGAIARAFDEPGDADPDPSGITVQSLNAAVNQHAVASLPGTDTGRTWSWTCPPEWTDAWCVRVNVFRNGEQGSPLLPIWFGQTVGLTSQGTRATATALAATANWTECLKPWLIPDKFQDNDGDGVFSMGDVYSNPGWTEADIGTTLILKEGNPSDSNPIAPSDFFRIEEADTYEEAITGCEITQGIGDWVTTRPGNGVGPTRHGVEDLLAAHDGGPVTVLVGMFDPAAWSMLDRQSGTYDLQIVNMMGFKIYGYGPGNQIVGEICAGPAELGGPEDPTGGNLLKKIMLVR